jgi:hypothetical protein
MEIIVWILSVQLWTETDKIKFVYTKEYSTYEQCMDARETWATKEFRSFCLIKYKSPAAAK